MQKRNPLVAFALMAAAAAMAPISRAAHAFRGGTPSSSNRGLRDKSGYPSGYPGAKLARKAMRKTLTLRGV